MEIIVEFFEKVDNAEEYFKILLSGLFGIATIVVAVTSIAGNIINEKCLNMRVNKLWRYNILVQFSPIYYLVFYTFFIIKFNDIANCFWVNFICVLIFLILITRESYLSAQYILDTEKFEDTILNYSIKRVKKDLEKKEEKNNFVFKTIIEISKNINHKDSRIFKDKESREKLYKKYLNLIEDETLDIESMSEILNILIDEFGIDKAIELCSEFDYGIITSSLLYIIPKNNVPFLKIVERIHSYVVYAEIVDTSSKKYLNIIRRINAFLLKNTLEYFSSTIDYLINTEFSIKDALYLSEIFEQILYVVKNANIDELDLNILQKEFLKELIKAYREGFWKADSVGNEKIDAFNAAIIKLGGN